MISLTAIISNTVEHWPDDPSGHPEYKQRTHTGQLLAGKFLSDQVMSDLKAFSKYTGKINRKEENLQLTHHSQTSCSAETLNSKSSYFGTELYIRALTTFRKLKYYFSNLKKWCLQLRANDVNWKINYTHYIGWPKYQWFIKIISKWVFFYHKRKIVRKEAIRW